MNASFKKPYYVQRLHRPGPEESQWYNAFDLITVIDRGMWESLRRFFDFEGMGSAEYELGSRFGTQKTIGKLLTNAKDFVTATIHATVEHDGRPQQVPVYVIAPNAIMPQASAFVLQDIAGETKLRDASGIARSIQDNLNQFENTRQAWLELENGFMYFTDEGMFRKLADGLGLKPYQEAQVAETLPVQKRNLQAVSSSQAQRLLKHFHEDLVMYGPSLETGLKLVSIDPEDLALFRTNRITLESLVEAGALKIVTYGDEQESAAVLAQVEAAAELAKYKGYFITHPERTDPTHYEAYDVAGVKDPQKFRGLLRESQIYLAVDRTVLSHIAAQAAKQAPAL